MPIHIVIDLIHVLEYLWKAAWCLHATDDPAAEYWVAAHALALLAGHLDHVVATLDAQATTVGLTEQQRGGIDACIRYLTGHAEFLRYDQPRPGKRLADRHRRHRRSLPPPHRRPPRHHRRPLGLAGAEAILKLRALISCGDFATY